MQIWHINRLLILTFLIFGFSLISTGQQVPSKPLSIPVYSPILLNPAFAGSKDFTSINLTTKVLEAPDNQVLSVNKRLYSPQGVFTSVGIGAYVFREKLARSWNGGLAIAGAYHVPLDKANIHNLSVGLSLKGIMNNAGKNAELSGDADKTVFNPNMDLGIYYYGPSAFGGLSVTSFFGTSEESGITYDSDAYVPREYHFYGGYKFLVNKPNAIVIEPSLLISMDDSTLSEPHRQITPYLKLYLQNFYIGTYLKTFDQLALFFQYQFPRLYTGVFLEFPRVGYLNDENIIFELILGVNLGKADHKFLQFRHW